MSVFVKGLTRHVVPQVKKLKLDCSRSYTMFNGVTSLDRGRRKTIQHTDRSLASLKGITPLQCISTDVGSLDGSGVKRPERPWSKTCGCCGLNTKGDKEFADFLKEELNVAKESFHPYHDLPTIQGFTVSRTDGPTVVLERKTGDEVVSVKFNIRDSLVEEDISDVDFEDLSGSLARNDSIPMVSKPSLMIEISKPGQKVLGLKCSIRGLHEMPTMSDFVTCEDFAPLEIHHLALYEKSDQWNDDVYCLSSYILDKEFHDRLLFVLLDRSIDRVFVQQLLDFTTSYEHQAYMSFLKQLHDFLTCSKVN